MTTKKPLFNRPAWASSGKNKTSTVTEEPVFGRQQIYEDILDLERREREAKERKAKETASSKEAHIPPLKKRRISKDDDDVDATSDSSIRSKPRRKSTTPDSSNRKPTTRSTPRKDRLSSGLDDGRTKKSSPKKTSKATVITLEDGDSDDDISRMKKAPGVSPSKAKSTIPSAKAKGRDAELFDSDDDDDPYLQELKAKARERQRLQRLGIELNKPKAMPTPAVDLKSPTPVAEPSLFDGDFHDEPVSSHSAVITRTTAPSISPVDDPEVQIYIKPLIPNTKALIVGRKASQTLESVKTFWCKKQGLTDAEAAKVFFTWRDIKLFNSSTMRSIIDRLKKEKKPGQDDSDGKVVIDAVTQEIFDYHQAEKARRAAAEAAAEDGGLDEEVSPRPPEPAKGDKFIIRLQSKEYGEMPIRIRPESTVGKIAGGFMQQMAPDTTKTPYLIFDGDRLESEQTAQEIGLEDGDVVEVQFR